ncbi:hypothetical protein [uncultured Phascolarctobacterium sp.]|uniref:hypothetical protein n=1 Tax=uncultured Phascolarctobacterium sp. TaxID=512296 RepID=UPI002635FD3B|nr:hypothetical protein [uncultured Phascolarctobacterium sp.]
MADSKQLKDLMRKIVRSMFPEMSGYQYPIKARVVKLHTAGGRVTEYNKRYSVDVQPLKQDGSVDATKPVIPDVPIDIIWAGNKRGIFCLPKCGTVVRIGFYHWDAAMPFVSAVLGDGYNVPEHPADSLVIQQADGTAVVIEPDGKIKIETGSSKLVIDKSALSITAKTITVNGGAISVDTGGNIAIADGGPAIARVGDSVQCSCGTGTITSGSSRATCGG